MLYFFLKLAKIEQNAFKIFYSLSNLKTWRKY